MEVNRIRIGLLGAACAAAAVFGTATARAQGAPADSSTLLDLAAVKAREVATRLESANPAPRGRARPDPGLSVYLQGVAYLQKRQFDSAFVPLQAAATVGQDNPRYRGDLAYALASLGRLEEAGNQYLTAVRLQSANPWYYVGVGVVRANLERWQEASANFTLAYATDSTILDPRLVAAASLASEKSGDEQGLLTWSERSTAHFPDYPAPWLRLASLLRSQHDTTRGLAAIRHYRGLKPDDKLGDAVYALYLFDIGQADSAVDLAIEAGHDTAMRVYAAPVLLRVGATWLSQRQYDSASKALSAGLAISPPTLHDRFLFYLSFANLQRLVPMFTAAVPKHDCAAGHVVDSLLTQADSGFHQTQAIDTAQTRHIIADILPNIHQRVGEFTQQCKRN